MRYFIIFYRTKSVLNEMFGDISWQSKSYPSRACVVQKIKEETGWLSVSVTGVIELTYEDFRSWGVE